MMANLRVNTTPQMGVGMQIMLALGVPALLCPHLKHRRAWHAALYWSISLWKYGSAWHVALLRVNVISLKVWSAWHVAFLWVNVISLKVWSAWHVAFLWVNVISLKGMECLTCGSSMGQSHLPQQECWHAVMLVILSAPPTSVASHISEGIYVPMLVMLLWALKKL